jgi:hypothetical protein
MYLYIKIIISIFFPYPFSSGIQILQCREMGASLKEVKLIKYINPKGKQHL